MKHATLGTIIQGTLRPVDLVKAFMQELEWQVQRNGDYLSMPEHFSERDRLNNMVGEAQDAFASDDMLCDDLDADELLEDLANALEAFAPPYCYFGAHPGDGADFGYWPSWDSIEELPTVEDSDEAKELGEDCRYVNDHGNTTVYNGLGEPILELV